MATLRRTKWHPPTPRTRRPRRRQAAESVAVVDQQHPQGKLETLFGQERAFCYAIPPVVLLNSGRERSSEEEREKVGIWEEKWRFQAEILRAECKFLRMERQIAVKTLQRERVFMESTLKSALQSLISARRKVGEGQNVSQLVLEEEIEELANKLGELQRSSKKTSRRDPELLKETRPSSSNFDAQSTLLHRHQLERIGGLSGDQECLIDVEILTRKMEGLSEGKLLKRMEDEYGSVSSRTASTCVANSRRNDFVDLSCSLQEPFQGQKICGGQCKVIVRRIMEQVRAETEQWSQMQEMVGQVREEMERLQASRDFWECRALDSDNKIQSLNATVQEWKQKALTLEIKEKQQEGNVVKPQPHPHEKEKRVLTCRVKGNIQNENRQPFRDVGNSKRWVLP